MILERITNCCNLVEFEGKLFDAGMSHEDKPWRDVGKTLADSYTSVIHKTHFDKIGSLYLNDHGDYYVGPCAYPVYSGCLKASYPPPGPFDSVFDLLREYLKLWQHANNFHGNIYGNCSMDAASGNNSTIPGSTSITSTPLPTTATQGQVEVPPAGNEDDHEISEPTWSPQGSTTSHSSDNADDSEFAFNYSEQDRQYDHGLLSDLRRLLKDLEQVSCASTGTPADNPPTYLVHRRLCNEEILVQEDDSQDDVQEEGQDEKITTKSAKIKALLDWEFAAVFPDELFYDCLPRGQGWFINMGHTWVPDPLCRDFPCDSLFDPRANGDDGLSKSLVKEVWAKASRADDGDEIDDQSLGKMVTLDFLGSRGDQEQPPPLKASVGTLRGLAQALEEDCWQPPGDMAPHRRWFLEKLRWAFLYSKVKRRESDPVKRELKFRYIYS
ncbi:hypothetical protein PG988_004902 [Apiospora saccharicola]